MENKNDMWIPYDEYIKWKELCKEFNENIEKYFFKELWENDDYTPYKHPNKNVIIEKIPHI